MIPIDGFTKDILMHGLSRIIVEDVDEIDNSTLAEIFKNYVDSFKEKVKNAGSSKLSRNDKESYTKTYQKWFNTNPPGEYVSLMLDIIEKTINLLEDNKIDAKKSLETINVGKNSVNFGIPYNESYAILPAIIKQVEYYEFLSEFLSIEFEKIQGKIVCIIKCDQYIPTLTEIPAYLDDVYLYRRTGARSDLIKPGRESAFFVSERKQFNT